MEEENVKLEIIELEKKIAPSFFWADWDCFIWGDFNGLGSGLFDCFIWGD